MPKWLCGDWLLSQFGKNLRQARKNYQAFVEESDPWAMEDPGQFPVGGFIPGSEDFVNWVQKTFLSSEEYDEGKHSGNISGAAIAVRS